MEKSSSSPLPSCASLSTVNVANFVTLKLSVDIEFINNYDSWKVQMLGLLSTYRLEALIDGTVHDLSDNDIRTTDMMVKGWILGTVSDPTLLTVVGDLESAQQVWSTLKDMFTTDPYCPFLLPEDEKKAEGSEISKAVFRLWSKVQKDEWDEDKDLANESEGVVMALLEAYVRMIEGDSEETLRMLMNNKDLGLLKNPKGSTPLHIAAAVGNLPAAKFFVQQKPSWCYDYDGSDDYPLHYAALHKQKDMVKYLLDNTTADILPSPYAKSSGLRLFLHLIEAEFFDIAIDLVHQHQSWAWDKAALDCNETAFTHIIRRWKTLRFKFCHRFIIKCLPWPLPLNSNNDIEGQTPHNNQPLVFLNVIWNYLYHKVGPMRRMMEKRAKYAEALQLVELLCQNILSEGKFEVLGDALLMAAELRVTEVVEKIKGTCPLMTLIYSLPCTQYLIQAAVETHSFDIFSLVFDIEDLNYLLPRIMDSNNNNALHLAAKLAPPDKLKRINGAALRMQYERKWYKTVESLVHSYSREQRNLDDKTPRMVFTKEHETLKKDGEEWMKDTANSCTIAAALIATVMFASAITVPGGNNGNTGYPFFSNDTIFTFFAIFDAISLFTSIIALIMFLYILTSRYEVDDFVHTLPKRLIIGLSALIFSIAFMMACFGIILYLVFGQKRIWVFYVVMALACLPIFLFALLQLPLLIDLIRFTYGPGFLRSKKIR